MSWSETTRQREARERIATLTAQRNRARDLAARLEEENHLMLWLLAESQWRADMALPEGAFIGTLIERRPRLMPRLSTLTGGPCGCTMGRCIECATDEEIVGSIPPFPGAPPEREGDKQ